MIEPVIKTGYCQFDVKFNDIQKNYDKVSKMLNDLDFDIMVLPELFTSGYFFKHKSEIEALAEPAGGPSIEFLKNIAKEKKAFIYAGFPEKTKQGIYNSSVLVGYDDTEIYYRKAHLFFNEKKYFLKADHNFVVKELTLNSGKKVTVGLMICFDWFFPEAARTLALNGAQLILHTANLVMPYCPDAMPTRCIENQVFSITCNRVGTEIREGESLSYIGRSVIVDNKGRVLAEGPEKKEKAEIVEIANIDDAKDKYINPMNDIFEDRRTDLYKLG